MKKASKSNQSKRKILITAALPYANGPLHIGHLVEHFYTDFWSRFQRMRGHECRFFCADDTHGTPIMVLARKQNKDPVELINKIHTEHVQDLKNFEVLHDYYGSTNSETNKELTENFFKTLLDKKHISTKSIDQLFCNTCNMFLPDRFVKGTCPKCKTPEQYGDQCDNCSANYEPIDLINPRCSTCNSEPKPKKTEHLYFKLSDFQSFLKDWIPEHINTPIANKLLEWFNESLKDWCISRDEPYFGFGIPGHPNKYFYVWLDAPIGYISTTKEWCKTNNQDYKDYWLNPSCEIYHVIGKDIPYFHALFWPAVLKACGYNLPTQIFVHGFLTINGEKMSKSKGTFIPAGIFSKYISPTYLRYYLACKINSGIVDFDLSQEDFITRVNSDLIGKITNIASRGAQMLNKNFGGKLVKLSSDSLTLIKSIQGKSEALADLYENRDFSKVMTEIRQIADETNKYYDEHAPWKLLKEDPIKCQEVLTTILNIFRIITVYITPIVPSYSQKVIKLFREDIAEYTWDDAQKTSEDTTIDHYSYLASRIEDKQFLAIIDETKANYSDNTSDKKQTTKGDKMDNTTTISNHITIDDFSKIQLKVAKVINAEAIPEANKLLKLTVDLGSEERTIFAGIKSAYLPESLIGKLVVVVANLAPRKMKFGISEGMVLAASHKNSDGVESIFVLHPDSGAKPGDTVS